MDVGRITEFNPQVLKKNNTFERVSLHSHQVSSKLKENLPFSQGLNFLINYWELKPAQYENRLQELSLKGIKHISTFVPWSHFETDIYHSLKKFLKACWNVKMPVKLFIMPELGVNYPNCGIPKELLADHANLATDKQGNIIYNVTAPNIFPLPSFMSPVVLKHFGNYLIKLGGLLNEVFQEVKDMSFCEVIISNSFFNYYRNFGLPSYEHGDYSASQVLAFQDFLDRQYPTLGHNQISNPLKENFKTLAYENYNRHRFLVHVEKLLREKTELVFAKKHVTCSLQNISLINPETAPEVSNHSLLTEVLDYKPCLKKYYDVICSAGTKKEWLYLHFANAFRRFNDQERSFLALASLIHAGNLMLFTQDYFKFSIPFRKKLEKLVNFFETKKLVKRSQVSYLAASLYSANSTCLSIFQKMTSNSIEIIAKVEGRSASCGHLVFVDPTSIINLLEFLQFLNQAQTGSVVAIPKVMQEIPNFTQDAKIHFEKFSKIHPKLKINLGLQYEVYSYGLGQVVFYAPEMFWKPEDNLETQSPKIFFQSLLGLAEFKIPCLLQNQELKVEVYCSKEDGSDQVLFLINPTAKEISSSIEFPQDVILKALPTSNNGDNSLVGKNFEIAVPSLGVVSMQVFLAGTTAGTTETATAEKFKNHQDEVIAWT